PFVDVAMYMGVIIFFLALFAVITRWRDPIVQFLAILAFIALLISFGKNFPVLFDFIFYHLPYFDKFRVPSMSLVLVQICTPILAGLGLMKIISLKEKRENGIIKIIKNSAIVLSAFFILSVVLKSSIADWFTGRINDYISIHPQASQEFTALSPYMSDMFTADLLIAFALLAITFWLAYSYINSKISRDALVIGIIVLSVFDLFRIDSRGQKYVDNPDLSNMFNPPEYVTAIKSQKDTEPFRMINIKQDGSRGTASQNNGNYNAYFMLEDFYGYSGIKPRSFQDLMDVIGPANPTLWRMLNVKYVVASQQIPLPGFIPIYQKDKEVVYKNTNALPRAYFVDKIGAKPDLSILNDIKTNSFDPKSIAYVDGSLPIVDVPDSTAKVNITKYKDEIVELDAKASGNNFLFFGNTYLPTGWKAYIDGNESIIYKVDHGFMGIVVPKGKHIVDFKYAPKSFFISEYVALSLSALTILGLLLGIVFELRRRKNNTVTDANVS
ncbi:MAG: YfhO family protein, partial [Ignavibacteriaceae bacterium]|nr:YfhO family protein [Ignavibacteriaceae bacterium]